MRIIILKSDTLFDAIYSRFIYHAMTHKKLPSRQCYHIYSETRGVYLTKNYYDNYSLKWYWWLKFVVLAHGLELKTKVQIRINACCTKRIIISPDKSRGYTGFTSIPPLPLPMYVLTCVRNSSKSFHRFGSNLAYTSILVR